MSESNAKKMERRKDHSVEGRCSSHGSSWVMANRRYRKKPKSGKSYTFRFCGWWHKTGH